MNRCRQSGRTHSSCGPRTCGDEPIPLLNTVGSQVTKRACSLPGARCLAQHVPELDGSELENAHVAFGGVLDASHERVHGLGLSGIARSRDGLTSALVMLPQSLNDDHQAQLIELMKRRAEVERVSDPELNGVV